MTKSNATALKPKKAVDEVLTDAVKQRRAAVTTPEQKTEIVDKRFEAIHANTFYKVVLADSKSPEEKRAEIAKLLTFEGTSEQNRERLKEFELFKEYLQHERELMAQAIIKLTDTEAFSELKDVYDQMNNSLIDFDNRMRPLTDIIDAVYQLRTNGMTMEAFQEILRDRKAEQEREAARNKKGQELAALEQRVTTLNRDIEELAKKRSFFGFGDVTEEARVKIDLNKTELQRIDTKLKRLSDEIAQLDREAAAASDLGEFAPAKAKLRELLDISTDEHKQRQRDLVDAALNFVNTSKNRISSVRSHLELMDKQVHTLASANNNMTMVYAVLNEGINDAVGSNHSLREQLQAPEGKEDLIAKMTREQKKMAIEQHMALLNASAGDTMETYADLTSGAIRIKTMKDAVEQQSTVARTMHSRGVSGVADRLSVVLQAVSSAALGEASAMARETLNQMTENTNRVAQKESIRIAMGIEAQNAELAKAIDDLGSYGEVMRAATDITREGISEMRGKLDELKKLAETVQGDVHDAIAVTAETMRNNSAPAATEEPTKPANPNPFGLG